GRRPSYVDAAGPEQAEALIELLVDELASLGAKVATGRFRAHMAVELVNDGPVTILLET
ncbi:MAG: D-aminoacyl-tRNA deacylase, partial [Acidimicrobiales bacterium]